MDVDKFNKFTVDCLLEEIDKYNEWEQEFIESIALRIERGIPLSEKQSEVLSRIWKKV